MQASNQPSDLDDLTEIPLSDFDKIISIPTIPTNPGDAKSISTASSPSTAQQCQPIEDYSNSHELNRLAVVHIIYENREEGSSRYLIENVVGEPLFTAQKDDPWLTYGSWNPNRPFTIKLFDCNGLEMFYFKRLYRFTSCCCFLCLQKMKVSTNSKEKIGTIEQKWSFWSKLVVKNASDETCLTIRGPWTRPHFRCRFIKYDNFKIFNNEGAKIGQILKEDVEQGGNEKDLYTLHFPKTLSIEVKSLLIGSVFLIDYMYNR